MISKFLNRLHLHILPSITVSITMLAFAYACSDSTPINNRTQNDGHQSILREEATNLPATSSPSTSSPSTSSPSTSSPSTSSPSTSSPSTSSPVSGDQGSVPSPTPATAPTTLPIQSSVNSTNGGPIEVGIQDLGGISPKNALGSESNLKFTDFDGTTNDLDKSDVSKALDELSDAVTHFTPSTNNDDNDCVQKMKAIKESGDDKKLIASMDSLQCQILADSPQGKSTTDITMTAKKYIECEKSAFAQFANSNIATISSVDLVAQCPQSSLAVMNNFEMKDKYSIPNKYTSDSVSKSALMKIDGSPCKFSTTMSTFSIEDSCQYFSLSKNNYVSQVGKSSTTNVFVGKYVNVSGKFNSKYYSAGSIEFTLNNWTGTITFSDTVPKFTATNKVGTSVSGTIVVD